MCKLPQIMTILDQAGRQQMVQTSLMPQTQHTKCSDCNAQHFFGSHSNNKMQHFTVSKYT